jgi:hypothetical protein
MFICEVCGRKFKTQQAFGGHISSAHPKNRPKAESAEQVEIGENAQRDQTGEGSQTAVIEEPGACEEIRRLAQKGYTFKVLTERFGFHPRTVRQEMEKVVPPEGNGNETGESASVPVTVKGTEVVTPEFIMNKLADGSDEWNLRLGGMSHG